MQSKCGVDPSDIHFEGGDLGFLLLHRLGGTSLEMEYVASQLAAAGHTVLCPLLFGHGGSRELLGATTWQHWYASVVEAHEQLKRVCSRQIVAALSAGAGLSLMLAAEQPATVNGLVLYAPTFYPPVLASQWFAAALRRVPNKRLANLVSAREREPYGIKDPQLRRLIVDRLAADGRSAMDIYGRTGGLLLEADWLASAIGGRLAEIKQPTLIFHARADDRDRASASYLLQSKLGGITDVTVLEDSYHLVTADRQQDLIIQRTLDFASQVATARK